MRGAAVSVIQLIAIVTTNVGVIVALATFLAIRFDKLSERIGKIDGRIDRVDSRIDALSERMAAQFQDHRKQTDARFDRMDERFDKVDGRFDTTWEHLIALRGDVSRNSGLLEGLLERIKLPRRSRRGDASTAAPRAD